MFLKNIKINNFRSIQKASVDFESGLNILIGKNGVGKSNLLKFINENVYTNYAFLAIRNAKLVNVEFTLSKGETISKSCLIIKLKRDKSVEENEIVLNTKIDVSRYENNNPVFENKEYLFKSTSQIRDSPEFRKDIVGFGYLSKNYIAFKTPSQVFWLDFPTNFEINSEFDYINNNEWRGFHFLYIFEDVLERTLISTFSDITQNIVIEKIDKDFLKALILNEFAKFQDLGEFKTNLKNYSPISDIRISENINIYFTEGKWLIENLSLEFKTNEAWVPWNYLSDGTKRLFYIITECLCQVDEGILLIEEPELGIHPHQLFSLMNFIKEQSETKQIIISTHSPIVLDVLPPDELNRITIVKLGEKGTEFHKLDNEQIEKAQRYMSEVGELSYYWLHSDLEDGE